jgi:hypothetical protein
VGFVVDEVTLERIVSCANALRYPTLRTPGTGGAVTAPTALAALKVYSEFESRAPKFRLSASRSLSVSLISSASDPIELDGVWRQWRQEQSGYEGKLITAS